MRTEREVQAERAPSQAPLSFLVTDPVDTQALRRMRQDRITDNRDDSDYIVAEQQGDQGPWYVFMRDTVPLEDANGQIPLP